MWASRRNISSCGGARTAASCRSTRTASIRSPSPATTSRAWPARWATSQCTIPRPARLGALRVRPRGRNGQYEINFKYSDALTTADRFTFFKMMTSQVAKPSAPSRPTWPSRSPTAPAPARTSTSRSGTPPGSESLPGRARPAGLGLSELAYHFLGGVLAHAPALSAVVAPTVNCYKRLLVGELRRGSPRASPGRPPSSPTATTTAPR